MESGLSRRRNATLVAFELGIVLPTLLGGAILVVRDPSALTKIYVPANIPSQPLQSSSAQNIQPLSSFIPGASSTQVPLSAFAEMIRTTAPLAIAHQEQFPSVTLSFNLAHGAALGDAVNIISSAERVIGMPSSVIGSYSGDTAEFAKSLAGEPWLILAAIVTIYIVLGVLYESFIHPFTILTTLPSAGVGALLALLAVKTEFSIIALIGIILLIGIVKKNAIMMIDFAIEAEREEGLSTKEAIYKACLLRFRPIVMTTLAALLGGLPLALGRGAGAELRQPLGVTIVGGLIFSQLITLFTTPVVYMALDSLSRRKKSEVVRGAAEPEPAR